LRHAMAVFCACQHDDLEKRVALWLSKFQTEAKRGGGCGLSFRLTELNSEGGQPILAWQSTAATG
jgi:hypothetical protein